MAHTIAVVGTDELIGELRRALDRKAGSAVLAGAFRCDGGSGDGLAESLDRLIERSRAQRFDEVVVALPLSAEEEIATAIRKLGQLPANVSLYPGAAAATASVRGLATLGDVRLLSVQSRPIDNWGRIAKSAFDRLASLGLLVLFAPVFAVVAVAIKLTSEGPVFFCQRRHGLNHRVINVWKFRTMRVMEDGGSVAQATSEDPRVTRVGKWLRRTSLDELPQLWNVLKGEMSLVGPRPHALVHNQYYGEFIEHYANRHKVKPGITGWAQTHGLRGNTEDPELMKRRVDYDLFYIENWSLSLDLLILAKTGLTGFVNGRAY